MTNRTCYLATTPLLYRNLAIPIFSPQKLQKDCLTLTDHLFCKKFLTHARCLKICGSMPRQEALDEIPPWAEYEPDDIEEWEAEFGHVFGFDEADGSADYVYKAWSPLATIIQKFTHIRDLIWVCRNQLPQCLFQAIRQHHPSCRVEIRTFRLLSLRQPITDSHERDLIQSPCLHSISLKRVGRDCYGNADYNEDAIFRIIALAPNLRNVNIVPCRTAAAPNFLQNMRKIREPWKGFNPPLEISGKGALRSLTYHYDGMSLADLQEWSKYTEWSKLRFLMPGEVSDPRVFDHLSRIYFKSLKTLDVALSRRREFEGPLYSAESFIKQLEPLKDLRMSGYLTLTVMDQILRRHGPTLRHLTLNRTEPLASDFRAELIRNIETNCPALEYLGVSVPPKAAHLVCDPGSENPDFPSALCPSLPYLRELVLTEHPLTIPPPGSLVEGKLRQLWRRINNEKGGRELTRLVLFTFDVSPIFTSIWLED